MRSSHKLHSDWYQAFPYRQVQRCVHGVIVIGLLSCTSRSSENLSSKINKGADVTRDIQLESDEMNNDIVLQLQVPAAWAKAPRFRPVKDAEHSLRVLPDGNLSEWKRSDIHWEKHFKALPSARHYQGPKDLSARFAWASYRRGISFSIIVDDDRHLYTSVPSKFDVADHIDIELWPGQLPKNRSVLKKLLGFRFRVGSSNQLIEALRPPEAWRAQLISSVGVSHPKGYQIEARIPLSAFTPLLSNEVVKLYFTITIHDIDDNQDRAEPTLRFSGAIDLDPPLRVPEAVDQRFSVRMCMAAFKSAFWSYKHGWRCGVPYRRAAVIEDDSLEDQELDLGHPRLIETPTIVWIREKIAMLNFPGVDRGIIGLFDKQDALLSMLKMGVIGSTDPGNPKVKKSDAEVFKLPDGTFALAVIHTIKRRKNEVEGSCAEGNQVYLSIIALRGAIDPHRKVAKRVGESHPFLEEVFRTLLEDCVTSVSNGWSLSSDRRTIRVYSRLEPTHEPTLWRFKNGRYLQKP